MGRTLSFSGSLGSGEMREWHGGGLISRGDGQNHIVTCDGQWAVGGGRPDDRQR